MNRELLYRNYWTRIQRRLKERKTRGIVQSFRISRTSASFVDYYPSVVGTLPEKILFNAIARRRVNFYFAYKFVDVNGATPGIDNARPDFILPDYKIIIDPLGEYWHTLPGKAESDLAKFTLYQAAGYTVYIPSATQIITNVEEFLDSIPALRNPSIQGNNFIVGDRPFLPQAPIIARIQKRPKVLNLRVGRNRNIGVIQRIAVPRAIKKVPIIRDPLLTTANLLPFQPFQTDYKDAIDALYDEMGWDKPWNTPSPPPPPPH